MPIPSKNPYAGFTLIETLVAFLILGLAASALLSILHSGPIKVFRANNERIAALAAKSVLSLAGNEIKLEKGTRDGEWPGNIKWELFIQPYREAGATNSDSPPTNTVPYLITAKASVGHAWNSATATITTLRLKEMTP